MFILTEIEEDVKVQPSDLSLPPLDAVTDVIEQRFIDKVNCCPFCMSMSYVSLT